MALARVPPGVPLWIAAVVCATFGWASDQGAWIGFATSLAGLAQVLVDCRQREGFGASTIWGASMMLTGFADGVGLSVSDPTVRDYFFLYAVPEYLTQAVSISFVGGCGILAGFALAKRPGPLRDLLPSTSLAVVPNAMWYWTVVAGVVVLVTRIYNVETGSGTISRIYYSGVPLIVFVLAREATRRESNAWLWTAALLAYAEAIRAGLFDFLRGNILMPLVALVLGCLIGARGLRPFRQIPLLPMYAGLVVFVLFFQAFGENRSEIGTGLGRVEELTVRNEGTSGAPIAALARLTSFNQVSQVVLITESSGFEFGQTLSYFGYVFVPRFIWPDKPMIAQGRWFAERIGLGRWQAESGFSNSVNMTIAGEWYLNFGWPGVIIGTVMVGLIVGLFWNAARFWSAVPDPISGLYGFYVLVYVWGLNIDLQVIPTLLAVYLLFLAFTRSLGILPQFRVRIDRTPAAFRVSRPAQPEAVGRHR